MYFVMMIVFAVLTVGLWLSILIGAFRQSAGDGLLSLFVPFYNLYFAFTKWQFSKRAAVAGGYLVATMGVALFGILAATHAAADALSSIAQAATAEPGSKSTSASTASDKNLPVLATCTIKYPTRGLAECRELNGMVPTLASDMCKGDEGSFSMGSTPCPSEGATGKCTYAAKNDGEPGEVHYFYAAAVGDPKGSCELLGASWSTISSAPASQPAANNAPAKAPAAPPKAPAASKPAPAKKK